MVVLSIFNEKFNTDESLVAVDIARPQTKGTQNGCTYPGSKYLKDDIL